MNVEKAEFEIGDGFLGKVNDAGLRSSSRQESGTTVAAGRCSPGAGEDGRKAATRWLEACPPCVVGMRRGREPCAAQDRVQYRVQ